MEFSFGACGMLAIGGMALGFWILDSLKVASVFDWVPLVVGAVFAVLGAIGQVGYIYATKPPLTSDKYIYASTVALDLGSPCDGNWDDCPDKFKEMWLPEINFAHQGEKLCTIRTNLLTGVDTYTPSLEECVEAFLLITEEVEGSEIHNTGAYLTEYPKKDDAILLEKR